MLERIGLVYGGLQPRSGVWTLLTKAALGFRHRDGQIIVGQASACAGLQPRFSISSHGQSRTFPALATAERTSQTRSASAFISTGYGPLITDVRTRVVIFRPAANGSATNRGSKMSMGRTSLRVRVNWLRFVVPAKPSQCAHNRFYETNPGRPYLLWL